MKNNSAITPAAEPQSKRAIRVFDDTQFEGELVLADVPARPSLRKPVGILLKALAVSILVFILWRQFAGVKIDAVIALLDRVGYAAFLALIPPLLELIAETHGLALCIPGSQSVRRLVKVVPVRIGCDALINSLPAGVIPAETLRPAWLRRACSLPMEESVAACLMGKINMAASQGLFLVTTMVLVALGGPGHDFAGTLSAGTLVTPLLVLILVFAAVGYIYTGARITQLMSLLKRIAWKRWTGFLSRIEPGAGRVDATILHFARRDRRALFASLGSFVVGWILLGSESYLILRILGQNVSVGQGLLMEGIVSCLRIALFFIPSAFGAAEAAYASLITGFGVAHPATVALAFIAIKRSQELLWMALGYLALLISGKRRPAEQV